MREHGALVKRKCRDCLRVALVYPAIYRAAVASLAFQNLYYMLNSMDYVVAERFVATSMSGEEPPPRSLETGAPLPKFDLILVSVSYELDYVTLARILLAAGLRRAPRGERPPVVVGGPPPSANPLVALGLADLVAVGEAEALVPRLVARAYEEGAWRAVEGLACSRGFIARECEEPVKKDYVQDLDEAFHSVLQFRVPGSGEPWGEAYMVEVSRGCPYACRFCLEAYFSRPLRHRSLRKVLELVERGVKVNSVRRVAFYALSFFSHPHADELIRRCLDLGLQVTLGSLRADTLTEDRVELMYRAGQRVVTVAPETLDEQLCDSIGKCVPVEVVESVCEWAWRRPGMHVKLYLMVGLPGERDEHVQRTAHRIKQVLRKAPPKREALRISVNPLIPKPGCPLEGYGLVGEADYYRRVKILERALAGRVASLEALSYRYAYAQAVLARGDHVIAEVVWKWASMGGRLGQLWTAARDLSVDLDRYAYAYYERGSAPWSGLTDLSP